MKFFLKKILLGSLIDKSENESLPNVFIKYVVEKKNESFFESIY